MIRLVAAILLILLAGGCAGLDLKRLAPPGIIRYERIADEKEANPVIAEEIRTRRRDNDARFPKIGETAAGGAHTTSIPNEGVESEIDRMEAEREALLSALEAERAAMAAEDEDLAQLNEAGTKLSAEAEKDKAHAARDAQTRPRAKDDQDS